MSITVKREHDKEIITYEVPDGVTMEDLAEIFRRLALAMGYQPGTVNEYLPNE